jgi:hypothetical protein
MDDQKHTPESIGWFIGPDGGIWSERGPIRDLHDVAFSDVRRLVDEVSELRELAKCLEGLNPEAVGNVQINLVNARETIQYAFDNWALTPPHKLSLRQQLHAIDAALADLKEQA